jgi:hypothetical protein
LRAFDNRNPQPAVFSFSSYDNGTSSARVTASQPIAQSDACSGVKGQTVTTTLKPGVYTDVDHVHPTEMRGRMLAVP